MSPGILKGVAAILFALAAAVALVAWRRLAVEGLPEDDNSAVTRGRVIGTFTIPVLLLIAGVVTWRKARRKS